MICGKAVYLRPSGIRNRKTCSRACSAIERRKRIPHECERCKATFDALPQQKAKYCSRSCAIEEMRGKSITRGTRSRYRENAFLSYGRKCMDCGYDAHPEVLIVHHIDGNRKNGAMENLVPLCQNCHVLRHLAAGRHGRPPIVAHATLPN